MGNKNGYDLICAHCGKTFHHTNTQKRYCSDECKAAAKKKLICPICGKEFIQNAPAQKYCCEECHIKAKNMLARERFVEQTKLDFTGIEGIDYVECKICGQRMKQFHQAHLDMHNISREEYEKTYGKIQAYSKNFIDTYLVGANNPNHSSKVNKQIRKERSPFSREFYIKRGLNENDRIEFNKKVASNRTYNTQLSYYTNQGMTEDEAKEALSKRQKTYAGGSHSKICTEFIKSILEDNITNSKYLYGHNEKRLIFNSDNVVKSFKYDLTNEETKRIIEFNGDFWHGNPEIYQVNESNSVSNKTYKEIHEYDEFKYKLAADNGYRVMIVWENDYLKNKEEIIELCKKFIIS